MVQNNKKCQYGVRSIALEHMQENRVKLDNEHWYKRVPNLVENCHGGTPIILQNKRVLTDRAILNFEPDIITCKGKS
jgi:hypothetical protein